MTDFNQQENYKDNVENTENKNEKDSLEDYFKSLEKSKTGKKEKSISFKSTVEDYAMTRSKAILKDMSIGEYLTELASKDKIKGYAEIEEDLKKLI